MKHTRLVCEQLVKLEDFWKLDERQRQELFTAALLHDIGKPQTTRLQDGRLVSPKHGPAGAQIVRKLLWTEFDMSGTAEAQRMRETICLLIRYHTAPVNALKKDKPELFLRRIAANGKLASDFSLNMLCMLAEADVLGRIADDTGELCEQVYLCAAQAEESGCLNGVPSFPDAYTEHAYYSGRTVSSEYALYDDAWGEVTMLCGLPGTGKDTWIHKECGDLPMVSLDDIRHDMDVKPTDEQGAVIQAAKERAKTYLRAHQPFVFNATNVTERTRSNWINLFEQYNAKVRLVFLETGWPEEIRRNTQRTRRVPEEVIVRMLSQLTPPESHEAYSVEWETT